MSANGFPPLTIDLRWCPDCGRNDRVDFLRDKHYSGGTRCTGTPIVVTYRIIEAADRGVRGDGR